MLGFFASCVARRQCGRVVTVFQSDTLPLGTRLLRWPDGTVNCTSSDPAVSAALIKAIQENAARRTAIRSIDLPDGNSAGVLIESIAPPVPLTIFGAGDDAIPLVNLAKLVGWHVTVIDARPAYAKAERFPMADVVHCLRTEALLESPAVVFPSESMVMLMTHSFTRDAEILRVLLPRSLRYIGVLGPKSRMQRLLDELGMPAPSTLHGPAGLDIGAETPEEIAVSILSEMQSVLAQRDGGALRDRDGPIHDPVEQPFTTV